MNKLYSIFCLLLIVVSTSAQVERDFIRRGNRFMRDSLYDKAQIEYQKAIEAENTSALAHYNLGNALLMQSKAEDAMKEFEKASKLSKDPQELAHIYHNMGVMLQSAKQIDKALACYKEALRKNPHADDTRYNYLVCLHQLKNNQGQDNQDQQQDENGEDEKKEQEKNQQQEKKDKKNDEKEQKNEQDTPKPNPEQMSKENAEQMLQAAMQNEKDTQEKIQQAQQQPQRKHLQKQW